MNDIRGYRMPYFQRIENETILADLFCEVSITDIKSVMYVTKRNENDHLLSMEMQIT